MNEDSDDRKHVAELASLKAELVHAPNAGEAQMVAHELLYKTLEHGSAGPDPVCARLQSELERDPMQYRCLLDVWDGNFRRASEMVRDHMIELGKLGHEWSMRRSMAHLEQLASQVVHR